MSDIRHGSSAAYRKGTFLFRGLRAPPSLAENGDVKKWTVAEMFFPIRMSTPCRLGAKGLHAPGRMS